MAYIKLGVSGGSCVVEVPEIPKSGETLLIRFDMIKATVCCWAYLMVGQTYLLTKSLNEEYCGPKFGTIPVFSCQNINT